MFSEQDLVNASEDIRLGYKRMCQFIPLAESRISQGTLRNAFGNFGYTVELKYSGAIEMSTPDGNGSPRCAVSAALSSTFTNQKKWIFR